MNRAHFPAAIALGALLAAAPVFATPRSDTGATPASKPLCSTLTKARRQAADADCIADATNPANAKNPASSRFGGLPDTASNAESSMPSTASSPASSSVYPPSGPGTAASSTGSSTPTPKMSGDSTGK